ncbi:amino acid adenylation domain-containing protein, partial [Mesorhizobium sp. GbtcB19]|uniref:non-ribosomal peptide synthetase n=1 Tax=Mesorhizobium sp. GbtcB19 TaxID=2824764 RepID=UPI001C2F6F6F
KAGGAYVPPDPSYPRERLGVVVSDADPRLVLVDKAGRAALGDALSGRQVIGLDEPQSTEYPASDRDPRALGLTPRNLAYVIYTSGSTGTPKGVMVEHRGLCNLMRWYLDDLGLSPSDRVLLLSSYNFDLTQKNIFGPLMVGGALHLAQAEFVPEVLVELIAQQNITHINLSPSAFHALIDAGDTGRLRSLRRVVLGGEPIQPAKLQKLRDLSVEFVNSYGPTECSDVAAWHRLSPDLEPYLARSVPIGRPIPNTRLYVLDAYSEPVPLGVAGELYIGGVGVGRGYLNRPELTGERFMADRFSDDPQARMYRTGDLVRYLPDGNIEFLGRNDHQVKIRGFRIELGEIEARLVEHAAVREAVVIAREDTPGDKRLVAYVVARDEARSEAGDAGELAAVLRAHLSATLPEYMVPAAYVAMEALPLTPNGKLDRRALPAPDEAAFARGLYEPPQGEVETILAGIWQEQLGVEQVGRQDSFVELGGHSLL